MNITSTRHCALALIPLLGAAFLIQACGGGGNAVAQGVSDADAIEGAWESSVTIRDCTSGAALRTLKGASVLHRGGTATATNNLPPASNGIAIGSWKREATAAVYTVRLRFYRFNPDGTAAGAQILTRGVTLSADAKTLTGTIATQVLDNADAVLQNVCGTETAVRVGVV